MGEHFASWLLTMACVAWYCTIALYMAFRGFADIEQMLRRLGDKDRHQRCLPVDEVIAETKRLLVTVSRVGPHILSSANTIAPGVKPENFLAMVQAAEQFGRYPIAC
jgi:hypothetical protein